MENHIIINETSPHLRAMGRGVLAGKWKTAVIAALIYIACIDIPTMIFDALMPLKIEIARYYVKGVGTIVLRAPEISTITMVFALLVTGPFMLGLAMFFLNLARRKTAEPLQIFSGFENFGRAFCLFLLITVFTILWAMLLVVPGIIAAFRYSQAFFVMADHPEMSPLECLNESKRMMAGNKGKLFCLMLSFIGWGLLTILPVATISAYIVGFMGAAAVDSFVGTLILWIASAGVFWLTAYIQSTLAEFYEILAGNIKADTFVPGEY